MRSFVPHCQIKNIDLLPQKLEAYNVENGVISYNILIPYAVMQVRCNNGRDKQHLAGHNIKYDSPELFGMFGISAMLY